MGTTFTVFHLISSSVERIYCKHSSIKIVARYSSSSACIRTYMHAFIGRKLCNTPVYESSWWACGLHVRSRLPLSNFENIPCPQSRTSFGNEKSCQAKCQSQIHTATVLVGWEVNFTEGTTSIAAKWTFMRLRLAHFFGPFWFQSIEAFFSYHLRPWLFVVSVFSQPFICIQPWDWPHRENGWIILNVILRAMG